MDRTKTDSELQQEQSDELFARQLHEQLCNSDSVEHAVPPQRGTSKAVQEAADADFARQLQEEIYRQEAAVSTDNPRQTEDNRITVECPTCTFINYMKPSSSSKHWRCAQCHGPLKENASHPGHISHRDLVECRVCHCLNKLPSKKSDAILCGACYQELGSTPNTASTVEREESQRTVQLRCGQCSVINAVTVGVDVKKLEFLCGGCGVLNTMTLE
ncbi:hypothetical protein, conserved [Leishmania tarentolae]|uniref:Uncharacterized protein n=1 Tax=Leishmania tarentolae TaxID=5689 RepID=A0A640KGV6_LEITA|nr:hypothetical protein, conserved [Leishmania tarentolae]